jgi:hypothetical protein
MNSDTQGTTNKINFQKILTSQPLTVQIIYSKKIKSQKYNNQDNFLINK